MGKVKKKSKTVSKKKAKQKSKLKVTTIKKKKVLAAKPKGSVKTKKASSLKPKSLNKTLASTKKKSAPKPTQKVVKALSAPGALRLAPLDDRIVVRLLSLERVTAGGLILPDTATLSGNLKGAVVAVGRGHMDRKGKVRPLELKVGDQVLLASHAGSKVKVADDELLIVRESEVLGIVAK